MIKYILIVLFLSIFFGCAAQKYEYDDLIKLESTHKIHNTELLASLKELILDNNYFGSFENEVLVINLEKNTQEYEICVTVTDYETFRDYRPDFFIKLKGYSKYENMPVLLFGDVDDLFYRDLGNDFHDILGSPPVYTKDNPPIIYDPQIVCFEK